MDEVFLLPVNFHGKELNFPSRLLQLGYTYKFEVDVHGTLFLFEPDEEGLYRAIVDPEDVTKDVSHDLLEAIADAIVAVLK